MDHHAHKWSNNFFENLFGFEWELSKSPAGAHQWKPKNGGGADSVPDAHDKSLRHAPTMLTTDLALRVDPDLRKDLPTLLRKSGCVCRRLSPAPGISLPTATWALVPVTSGAEVPAEVLLWQDPLPAVTHKLIDDNDIAALKSKILASGLSVSELVSTAWASASTFRGSDKRGGANGARVRLAPQKDWEVNNPAQLSKVLEDTGRYTERIQRRAVERQGRIAGRPDRTGRQCAGVEKAAKNGGRDVKVPFTPGRVDASQEQTDVESFELMEPAADGFRNYLKTHHATAAEAMLVDKAQLLTLTAPELTVLVGGLRVLNTNYDKSKHGVFTKTPETLTNDFFVNLMDFATTWSADIRFTKRIRRP